MGSKRSIVLSEGNSHIYEETQEPQTVWGQFQGNNIYAEIAQVDMIGFNIKGEHFTLTLAAGSDLTQKLGVSELRIWGGDVLEVDYDGDGLMLHIKGGSAFARRLIAKNFTDTDLIFLIQKKVSKPCR